MTQPQRITLRDQKWQDATRILQQWVDSVQNLLSGGLKFGPQFGGVLTTTWNSDQKTPILLPRLSRPLALLCLTATTGNGSYIGLVPITWTWAASDGAATVTITAATGLASSTDYTLTLFSVEG